MSTKKTAKKAATNGPAVEIAVLNKQNISDDVSGNSSCADTKSKLTPKAIQKITELRGKVQSSLGQVVLAMMNLPLYKNRSLGDLNNLILAPLLQDRLVIACAKLKDSEKGGAREATAGLGALQYGQKALAWKLQIMIDMRPVDRNAETQGGRV